MTLPPVSADVPMTPYLLRYAAAYVLSLLLLVGVFYLLKMKNGSSVGGIAVVTAAFYVMGKFVEDHRRPLQRGEKRRLLWGSLLITLGIQLLAALALMAYLPPVPVGILLGVTAFLGVLYLLGLLLAYSDGTARRTLKGIERREQRQGRTR